MGEVKGEMRTFSHAVYDETDSSLILSAGGLTPRSRWSSKLNLTPDQPNLLTLVHTEEVPVLVSVIERFGIRGRSRGFILYVGVY